MVKDEPEGEGFLGRWSRRKAETKTVEGSVPVEVQDEQEARLTESETEQVDQPPEAVDPATLPDIDKMDASSDYSMFMQAGVPAELKTKALRKLWRVKPELANLDGLIDYGEDLTGSFKVVDHLKTAYKVGRGFLKQEDEDQAKDDKPAEQNGIVDGNSAVESEEKVEKINQGQNDEEQPEAVAQDDRSKKKPSKG